MIRINWATLRLWLLRLILRSTHAGTRAFWSSGWLKGLESVRRRSIFVRSHLAGSHSHTGRAFRLSPSGQRFSVQLWEEVWTWPRWDAQLCVRQTNLCPSSSSFPFLTSTASCFSVFPTYFSEPAQISCTIDPAPLLSPYAWPHLAVSFQQACTLHWSLESTHLDQTHRWKAHW